MAQPCIALDVDLCGLDQVVDLGSGDRTLGRITEQPCLALYNKRFYCALGSIVVYGQKTSFHVSLQPTPIVGQIINSVTQHALLCHLGLRFSGQAFNWAGIGKLFS